MSARDALFSAAKKGETLTRVPDLEATLLCVSRALRTAGIKHALIGGMAVAIQTDHRRATLDVDIAILTGAAHSDVVSAMAAAGFALRGEFPHSLNFRSASSEPVQLVFDTMYDAMIERAEEVPYEDETIFVLSVTDLIEAKTVASQDPRRRPSKAMQDKTDILILKGDVPDLDEGW